MSPDNPPPETLWNRRERDGKREVCRLTHAHFSDDCQWEVLNGLRVPAWFTYDSTSPIGGHIEIASRAAPPQDYGELLDRYDEAHRDYVAWMATPERMIVRGAASLEHYQSRFLAARQSLVDYVARQAEALLMFREEQDRDKATITDLRGSALTETDRLALLDFYDTGNDFNPNLKSAIARLRNPASAELSSLRDSKK